MSMSKMPILAKRSFIKGMQNKSTRSFLMSSSFCFLASSISGASSLFLLAGAFVCCRISVASSRALALFLLSASSRVLRAWSYLSSCFEAEIQCSCKRNNFVKEIKIRFCFMIIFILKCYRNI